jgi:hypothetical protein
VGRAFDLLVAPPTTLVLDGTNLPGLPPEPLDMPSLRRLLLAHDVPADTRDTVWRELVRRARRPGSEGQTWTVIAAGMALPGLTAAAGRLCRGWRGDTADLDAEVLAGFLAHLAALDLAGPRVVGLLVDAGLRAGRRSRARAIESTTIDVDWAADVATRAVWPTVSAQAGGHPDWVLARAVVAGVLDRTEARLIGATRLEDLPLPEVAAALRIDPGRAADWRWRAETRLAAAIRTGEIDHELVTRQPLASRDRPHEGRLAMVKAARHRHRRTRPTGSGDRLDPPA